MHVTDIAELVPIRAPIGKNTNDGVEKKLLHTQRDLSRWWALDSVKTGSRNMAVLRRYERVFNEILRDPNATYWSKSHYIGARKLLPVSRKPEVVMADCPYGYNMVYRSLESI